MHVLKPILIIIYKKEQIDSIIETRLLNPLNHNRKIIIYTFKNIAPALNSLTDYDVRTIPQFPKILKKSGILLSSSILWRYRDRSIAHLRRANMTFGSPMTRANAHYPTIPVDQKIPEYKRLLVRLCSNIYTIRVLSLIRKLFVNKYMSKSFGELGFNVNTFQCVILPYSGYLESDFDDFVNFFRSSALKVIAIQINWDHLSTKSYINSSPDFMCVWGKQSLGHASNIQKLTKTKVNIIGSPRVVPYFINSDLYEEFRSIPRQLRAKIKLPFIFYTGSGDGIYDRGILDKTLSVIGANSEYDLVYRPHPRARNKLTPVELNFFKSQGVIINDPNTSRQSVFDHCGLVLNADLMINHCSTMLVESLLANTKVLLPTFVDKELDYDFSDALDNWAHLVGLEGFPNVFISKSAENFHLDFLSALNAPRADSSRASNWICKKIDPSDELLKIVNSI
jgi:hypothetical protein